MEGGSVGDSLGQVEEKGCKGRRSSVAKRGGWIPKGWVSKREGEYRRVGYRRGVRRVFNGCGDERHCDRERGREGAEENVFGDVGERER
ncbi:unnamed protein product [Camellia sinensis]